MANFVNILRASLSFLFYLYFHVVLMNYTHINVNFLTFSVLLSPVHEQCKGCTISVIIIY